MRYFLCPQQREKRPSALEWCIFRCPSTPPFRKRVSASTKLTRDGVRVRQKKVREDTGAEVQADQIVKGYEYAKGQYVTLTDDELERIKTERDRTIRILHFAPP